MLLGQWLTRWIKCLIPTFISIFDWFHSSTFHVDRNSGRVHQPLESWRVVCSDYRNPSLYFKMWPGIQQKNGQGRKVFQTVFWLMILKVFLMTTYFRMETLWPHYKDDFMDFLLVNEFFVMEWIEQIYLNINHQSRLYIIQRVFQVCIIHSYRRSRSSVEVRYSSEAW